MSERPAVPLPKLLTAKDVTQATGIPLQQLYLLVRQGRIPAIRLGRAVRFSATAVAEWLAAGGTGYTTSGGEGSTGRFHRNRSAGRYPWPRYHQRR
jgi:excisionase family DNA binding protein